MSAIDRERFGSGALPIWVHHEHRARWRFASRYVAGKVIADCACGVGLGSAIFAEAGASRVHAFDLSSDAVAAARSNCAQHSSVVVTEADGRKLPLPSNSIEIFVSFESIEHIEDDRGFLREVVRVLARGGTFICSTPNRSITMPGKQLRDEPWNPFHVREYSQSEFLSMLKEFFDDVTLFGQNPKSEFEVKVLNQVGRALPGNSGGRINSALKLSRFIYDTEESHSVVKYPLRGECEYLVAVATGPLTN